MIPMSYEEAERLAQRLAALRWDVRMVSLNVFGSRFYLLGYHATLGSHRIESERAAAVWIARSLDQEAS